MAADGTNHRAEGQSVLSGDERESVADSVKIRDPVQRLLRLYFVKLKDIEFVHVHCGVGEEAIVRAPEGGGEAATDQVGGLSWL